MFKRSRRSPSEPLETTFVPPSVSVSTLSWFNAEAESEYTKWYRYQTELEQRRKWAEDNNKSKVAEMLKAAAAAAEAAVFTPQLTVKDEDTTSRKKSSKPKQSKEEKEALKEKRLMKLVGAVVVKCLSKYQKQMDHDAFKEHAKHVGSYFSFMQQFS